MDLFRSHQATSSQDGSADAGDIPSTSHTNETTQIPSGSVLFREIHKNAWLRKLPSLEKRSGAVAKKGERVWTVFCVHDDVHPFLELYMDHKMAAAHKPDWCVSLSPTLHISPTIVAHDQEYEFVITLPSDVVRLTAPSWETMMEWVDTIRSKLREMRILCPRENVYSRMPEPRLPLLPTRDPNSPLPPPPMGPSALVPGMEPVHLDTAESVPILSNSTSVNSSGTATAEPNTSSSSVIANNALNVTTSSTTGHTESRSRPRIRSTSLSDTQATTASQSPGPAGSSGSSARSPGPRLHPSSSNSASPRSPLPSRSVTSVRNPELNGTPVLSCRSPGVNGTSTSGAPGNGSLRTARSPGPSANGSTPSNSRSPGPIGSGSQNVTVIEVADSARTPCDIFNFNFIRDAVPHNETEEDGVDQFFTPPLTPRSRASIAHISTSDTSAVISPPPTRLWQQLTQVVSNLIGQSSTPSTPHAQSEVIRVAQGVTNITIPSQPDQSFDSQANSSVYEHVYPTGGNDTNLAAADEGRRQVSQTSSAAARQVAPVAEIPSTEPQRRRRRTSSGSEILSPRSRGSSNGLRPAAVPDVERRLLPVPHPVIQSSVGVDVVGSSGSRVTLRDQQVQQLRKEMLHPGGVRLQIRRKDCINSIAFIDAFGAVWIAGWKQREHPMLYNALHIGDQLLSTAGLGVQCAADAHRFIRASTSLYVPFVIRRVPFGRVFAFRRDTEGQSLGITLEGGTAEVRDVALNSPAARGGLTARAPTCDGISLTPWVITEINGRPLNLFFKDGEVRDRLNAVGKEISVLVQPFDLTKQIKKQLKAIRGYKDYIVQ